MHRDQAAGLRFGSRPVVRSAAMSSGTSATGGGASGAGCGADGAADSGVVEPHAPSAKHRKSKATRPAGRRDGR